MAIEFSSMFNQAFQVLDAAVQTVLENLQVESVERREITTGSVEYAVWKTLALNAHETPSDSSAPLGTESMMVGLPLRHRVVQLVVRDRGQELSQLSVGQFPELFAFSKGSVTESEPKLQHPSLGPTFETSLLELRAAERRRLQQQIDKEYSRIVDEIEKRLHHEFEEGEQYKLFFKTECGKVFNEAVCESPKAILELLEGYLASRHFKVLYDQVWITEIIMSPRTPKHGAPYIDLCGIFPSPKGRRDKIALGTLEYAPQPTGTWLGLRCTLPTASGALELIGEFSDTVLTPLDNLGGSEERVQHHCHYKLATCNKYLEIGKRVHHLGGSPLLAYNTFYNNKRGLDKVSLPTIKRAWAHYNAYQAELRNTSAPKSDTA